MSVNDSCPMVDELVDYREDADVESGTVEVHAEVSALAPAGSVDAAVADSSTSAPAAHEVNSEPVSNCDANDVAIVEHPSGSPDGSSALNSASASAGAEVSEEAAMVPVLTRTQREAQDSPEPLQQLSSTGRTPVAVPVPVPPLIVGDENQPEGNEEGEVSDEMADDPPSRNTAVVLAPHNGREFPVCPAPATFDDIDCYADDDVTIRTIGRAPWFDRDVVYHPANQLSRYDDGYGFLPGFIHAGSVNSYCWRFQYCVRDRDIAQRPNVLPSTLRNDFAVAAYDGLNRLNTIQPIPDDIDCDMFALRYESDAEYLRALNAIPEATRQGWVGVVGVRQEALCYTGPMLRLEFRYNTKSSDYWLNWCAEERFFRCRYGQVIPYHCPQAVLMNHEARRRSFVRLPAGWDRYEVPQGANVRTPRVFTYKPSQMLARDSPWFVVAYTEQVAETAVWLLFEVYDSLRLWWVSPDTIRGIRALDLRVVLGNQANVDELESLLCVIEGTRFEREPVAQSLRYTEANGCLGRTGPGGDFIYYDPWAEKKLTPKEYQEKLVRARPQMPAGHPTGYDFDAVVEGWDGRRYTPPNNNAGAVVEHASVAPVQYLVPEMQVSAVRYASFFRYPDNLDRSSPRSSSGSPAGQVAALAPVAPTASVSNVEQADVARRFLEEAGVEADLDGAGWKELVMFLRGRLSR